MSDDAFWTARAEAGRLTGHVVARCPDCGQRQMVAYSPPSTPWPKCRVCLAAPRLETWSDPTLVRHKRPGQPMTKTLRAQLQREREEADAPTSDPDAPDPGRVRHRPSRRTTTGRGTRPGPDPTLAASTAPTADDSASRGIHHDPTASALNDPPDPSANHDTGDQTGPSGEGTSRHRPTRSGSGRT